MFTNKLYCLFVLKMFFSFSDPDEIQVVEDWEENGKADDKFQPFCRAFEGFEDHFSHKITFSLEAINLKINCQFRFLFSMADFS